MTKLKRLAGKDMDLAHGSARWDRRTLCCTEGGFDFCFQYLKSNWGSQLSILGTPYCSLPVLKRGL